MSGYIRRSTARIAGICMGAITLYGAVTSDNTFPRILLGYSTLENIVQILSGEYSPITIRILRGLRIMR